MFDDMECQDEGEKRRSSSIIEFVGALAVRGGSKLRRKKKIPEPPGCIVI